MAGGSDPSRSGSGGGGGEGAEGKKASGDGGGGGVKERIARALRIYKESAARDGDDDNGGALVPVWAPARDGGRRVLATRGQPFVLAAPPQCHRLFQYRTVSLTHAFPVGDAGMPGERGLPGRVFDAGAPEWAPWAVVTGTTDGISRAIAFRLAATDLGLVLVGRNPEKLAAVAAEIKDKHPKVPEVHTFVLDFVGEGLAEGVEACSESAKRN